MITVGQPGKRLAVWLVPLAYEEVVIIMFVKEEWQKTPHFMVQAVLQSMCQL